MLRRRLAGAFAGMAVVAVVQAAEEFQPLFNGRDLSGWAGSLAHWSVQDGAITGRTTADAPLKQNSFLIWQGGEPADFELQVAFRISANVTGGSANSGIQYRSHVIDPVNFVVAGYQADIDLEGIYTGMLFEEKRRAFLARPGEKVILTRGLPKVRVEVIGVTTPPDEIRAAYRPGQWNQYVIIAHRNYLRHYLNGKLTAEAIDLDETKAAKAGVITLQIHDGPPMTVQFREIRLRRLP
jgi:hypothetical protein